MTTPTGKQMNEAQVAEYIKWLDIPYDNDSDLTIEEVRRDSKAKFLSLLSSSSTTGNSICCNYGVSTNFGEEGTNCYICGKCRKPCDVYPLEQVERGAKKGMEELSIYKFQAEQIEDTFRIVARVLKSASRTTCLDRDVMVSWEMIKNAIAGNIDVHVERIGTSFNPPPLPSAEQQGWISVKADINNKLTPFKNLIAMLEAGTDADIVRQEVRQCKENLEYLINLPYPPVEEKDTKK